MCCDWLICIEIAGFFLLCDDAVSLIICFKSNCFFIGDSCFEIGFSLKSTD